MAERVVQTCCCAPTFYPYVVICRPNIFVLYCSWQSYLRTYLFTYISSRPNIGCANFGPDWPLLFKVHEI